MLWRPLCDPCKIQNKHLVNAYVLKNKRTATSSWHALVAQPVERTAFNRVVEGSIPSGGAQLLVVLGVLISPASSSPRSTSHTPFLARDSTMTSARARGLVTSSRSSSSRISTTPASFLAGDEHTYKVRHCSVNWIGYCVMKIVIELEQPRKRPGEIADGKCSTEEVQGPRSLVFNVTRSSVGDDGPHFKKIEALRRFIMDVFDVQRRFTPSTIDAFAASIKGMIRTAWKEAKHVKTVLRGRRCVYKGTCNDEGRGCIERCMIGSSFCFVHSVSLTNKVMGMWYCFDPTSKLAQAHNNGVDAWDSTITYSCQCAQTEEQLQCDCIVNKQHHIFTPLPPLCIKMIFALLDTRQRCLLGLSCMELLQFWDTIKIEERQQHHIFTKLRPRWIKRIFGLLDAHQRYQLGRSCTQLWMSFRAIEKMC